MITTTLVDTTEAFYTLEYEWNALHENSNASFFMSFDWLKTWWETFETNEFKLNIILFYENDGLIGIAPLVIKTEKKAFGISTKTLQFLGTGEPSEADVCSELLDFVALPGHENSVAFNFVYFAIYSTKWDTLRFNGAIPGSMVYGCVIPQFGRTIAKEHHVVREELTGFYNYHIDLPDTWEEYEKTLRKSTKKRFRHDKRIFTEADTSSTKYLEDNKDIIPMLSKLKKLHEVRWATKNEGGAFRDQRFIDFHTKLIEKLLPKEQVILKIMSGCNNPFAAFYAFRQKDEILFYQVGLDTTDLNLHSGGSLNVFDSIRHAIDCGYDTFNFLKSGEDSYKTSTFACDSMRIKDFVVYPKRGLGYWMLKAKQLRNIVLRPTNTKLITQGVS